MFELHFSFDLLISLSQFIYSYRRTLGITESFVIAPRIINQEKGGAIIFVWNDVDLNKPSSLVTNFGVYDPEAQNHTVIYTYDKKVKVVSCSVNQERTLLAFSIVKLQELASEKKQKDVYQAFLAELQSVNKIVFSLNMERNTFLKVQFLYQDQQGQSSARDSTMLVFLHKESIGLYKVPVARIGDGGIMMSGQPKTEQIVRKFVWCQWDVQQQRLHYVQNIRFDNFGTDVRQKMSTLQFYDKGKYENMIEIPINFPFPYIRSSDKHHYADIPLHPGIPDLSLNMSVLTQSSGAFCLCYHKLIVEQRSKTTAQEPSDPTLQDVEYYISMVHHARTLYGCVHNLPRQVVLQKRLVFSWLGSYLVVMMPGCFVHLLNVGPNFEPCHHILLHDHKISQDTTKSSQPQLVSVQNFLEEANCVHTGSRSQSSVLSSFSWSETSVTSQISIPVFSDHCAAMKTLLPCQIFFRESGATGQHLYDYRSGCLMKLLINTDLMLESFCSAYGHTRLAILHYFILHNKDYLSIKKIFEVVTENLTGTEVSSMFTEYLVASNFAEMKKQVDKEVLNLLSFTSLETLRGQVEKKSSGERLAHISYSSLETVDLKKKVLKNSKSRSQGDFWDTLIRRLHLRHSQIMPRFSHDFVMRIYRQAEMEEAAGKPIWGPMQVEDSFFDGLFAHKLSSPVYLTNTDMVHGQSGRQSKLDSVLGPMPMFLQTKVAQESRIFKRRLSLLTEELLTKHLSKYLSKESHSKAKNVAKEYLYCQAKVSRQLCHQIWSLIGHQLSYQLDDCLLPSLQEPGTDKEYELFQLYERFYLTAGELGYPLPAGFPSFFTALGFKCLDLPLFFQYVDNHILPLTPDFVLQLLQDLPDDINEEVPRIKFQVLSRLPKPFAEECFECWPHPLAQERKARAQLVQIVLQGHKSRERSGHSIAATSSEDVTFPPLDTFMKQLETFVATVSTNRPISYDASLIENVALYNTKTKTNFDLSKVSF